MEKPASAPPCKSTFKYFQVEFFLSLVKQPNLFCFQDLKLFKKLRQREKRLKRKPSLTKTHCKHLLTRRLPAAPELHFNLTEQSLMERLTAFQQHPRSAKTCFTKLTGSKRGRFLSDFHLKCESSDTKDLIRQRRSVYHSDGHLEKGQGVTRIIQNPSFILFLLKRDSFTEALEGPACHFSVGTNVASINRDAVHLVPDVSVCVRSPPVVSRPPNTSPLKSGMCITLMLMTIFSQLAAPLCLISSFPDGIPVSPPRRPQTHAHVKPRTTASGRPELSRRRERPPASLWGFNESWD